MDKQSLKQKGLTPTHCAVLYLRYCLQHLPYNSDALAEVADVAPLNNAQYKAVQKALQSRLTNPAFYGALAMLATSALQADPWVSRRRPNAHLPTDGAPIGS